MSFYNIGMGEVKLPGPEVSTKEAIGITVGAHAVYPAFLAHFIEPL